jgi:hypothetical protein
VVAFAYLLATDGTAIHPFCTVPGVRAIATSASLIGTVLGQTPTWRHGYRMSAFTPDSQHQLSPEQCPFGADSKSFCGTGLKISKP